MVFYRSDSARPEQPPFMLTSFIVRITEFCVARAWTVVTIALLVALGSGYYAAREFRINSNIDALLPSSLGWRKAEVAFENAFRRFELIEVVVEAPTPELASEATATLTQALSQDHQHFNAVANPGGAEFFAKRGLMFLPKDALERNLGALSEGEPIIHDLATDRSLRGLIAGLEDALLGLQNDRLKVDDLATQRLLGPFRGEPAVDRERLIDVLVGLSDAAVANTDIVSADLNPLIVVDGAPVAVDALVELRA